jgi:hypothetical protein
MQFALSPPREMSMQKAIDRNVRRPTLQTGIWIVECCWLRRLFKSPGKTSPTVCFPDLLSACVSPAFRVTPCEHRLIQYLVVQLALRNPTTERRSCDIWAVQFEIVMVALRVPWSRIPNPMCVLGQITMACVAVAMSLANGHVLVLAPPRVNLLDRVTGALGLEC